MKFEPLTAALAEAIETWFDDAATIRYLGRRRWVHRPLDLVQDSPGAKFRGRMVLSRHMWVVLDEAD